ncbi:MAG: ABC transporter substrate-binding protein [bacterium]|nr:ABC transporter substrate-binding protein [bacterium]
MSERKRRERQESVIEEGRRALGMSRRDFLKTSAWASAAGLTLVACGTDSGTTTVAPATTAPATTAAATTTTAAAAAPETTTTTAAPATTTSQAPAAVQPTLIFEMGIQPRVINSTVQNIQNQKWIADMVEDKLYDWDSNVNIVPRLAAGMPNKIDDLTVEVTIKDGVTFHNGDALDAQAVADLYTFVQNNGIWRSHLRAVDSIEAVDNLTVRFNLNRPYSFLLSKMALINIRHRDWFEVNDSHMGSGPYVFSEFVDGQFATLAANENHWSGHVPAIRDIRFNFVPDPGARLVNLLSGRSHYLGDPRFSDLPVLEAQANLTTLVANAPVDILWFEQVENPPTDNLLVRQAIAFSMNRRRVNDVVFQGKAVTASGPLHSASLGYDPDYRPYPDDPDIEQARALLSQAGYGEDDVIDFDVVIQNDNLTRDTMVAMTNDWLAAGLKANLVILDSGPWVNRWVTGGFNVISVASQEGYSAGNTPWVVLGVNHSQDPANFHKYNNPRLDAILDEVDATDDVNRQIELWKEGNRLVAEDAVSVPPVYPPLIAAHANNLQGIDQGLLQVNHVRQQEWSFA